MRAILKTINFVSIYLIVREATELPYYFFLSPNSLFNALPQNKKGERKKFADVRIFVSFLYSSFAKFC
jgi:hypothetical protein